MKRKHTAPFSWSICLLVLASVWLLALPIETLAQKKKKPVATKKAPASEPAEPVAPPVNLAAEAAQVAEQLKIVARFLFVYGKVANTLDLAAEEERKGKASPAVIEQNQKARQAIVNNIAGVHTGLDTLIARFQGNARLQVQYLKLSYAVESITNAEKFAGAGRFDEAGKSLVQALERLTDVLIALR